MGHFRPNFKKGCRLFFLFCIYIVKCIFPLSSDNYTLIHSLQRKRSIDGAPNNGGPTHGYNRNNSPLPEHQHPYSGHENVPSNSTGQHPIRSYVRPTYVSSASSNRDWRNPKATAPFSYDNADRYNRARVGPGPQRERDNPSGFGAGRRFISSNRNDRSNNRFSSNRRYNDNFEESPEWMDFGPDSMNDFIDLKGFDEGEPKTSEKADQSMNDTKHKLDKKDLKDISNLDLSDLSKVDLSSFLLDDSFMGKNMLDNNDSTSSAKSSRFARFFKQAPEKTDTQADADNTSSLNKSSNSAAGGDGEKASATKMNIMDMLKNNGMVIGDNVPKLDMSKATTLEELESMMAVPVEAVEPKKIVKNEMPFPPAPPPSDQKSDDFFKLLSKLKQQPTGNVGGPLVGGGGGEQPKTDQSARSGEKLIEAMQQIHSQQQQQQAQQQQPLPLPPRMNMLNAGMMPPGAEFPFPMKTMAMPMVGPQPAMIPPNSFIPFYFPQMPTQIGGPSMCGPAPSSMPVMPPYMLNLPLHPGMMPPGACLSIPPQVGPPPPAPAMPRMDNSKQHAHQQQQQQQKQGNNFEQNNTKQRQDHSNLASNNNKSIYKNPQFVPTSVFRKMKDDGKPKAKASLNSVAMNNNNILMADNNRKGKCLMFSSHLTVSNDEFVEQTSHCWTRVEAMLAEMCKQARQSRILWTFSVLDWRTFRSAVETLIWRRSH